MNTVNVYCKITKETFVIKSINNDNTITLSNGRILNNIEISKEWILL